MKASEASANSEKRIRKFFRLWRERKVRDPEVTGSIGKIWHSEYPRREVRKRFNIGGPNHNQITKFEQLFMCVFLVRTYCDWLYFWRKIRIIRAKDEDIEKVRDSESRLIEKYIFCKFPLLLILFIVPMPFPLALVIGILIGWDILGLLFQPLRILFVDRYACDLKQNPPCYWTPYSFNRSLLLLLWSYIEMFIGFAYMYRHFDIVRYVDCVNPITVGQALYFSIVTITTLGYGDLRPVSRLGRTITSIEAVFGIVLLIMVMGLFLLEHGRQKSYDNK